MKPKFDSWDRQFFFVIQLPII
ncbi:unnamed protein product [Debaryomyces tyrocola]|nr:unnamed protein product [Debaryomyces tyrocola]